MHNRPAKLLHGDTSENKKNIFFIEKTPIPFILFILFFEIGKQMLKHM